MIYLVTHEFAPFRGGCATYVREVAAAAAQLGYPVCVVAPDYGLANHPDDADETFRIERVPGSGRLTPAGIARLMQALHKRRSAFRDSPVILLSIGALMAMLLLRRTLGFAPGRPAVCFFHGSEVVRFQGNTFWRALASRELRSARPACATAFVEALLRDSAFYDPGETMARAPCALPRAFAQAVGTLVDQPVAGKFTLLTVARVHPRKGQHLVAEALRRLPPEMKSRIRYQMVGTGAPNYCRKVESACQASGVEFQLLGPVSPDKLSETYAACDAFIMTSVALAGCVEGFGISYLEAAAHGKPVIAFRTGGVAEAVQDGLTGMLLPEGDLDGVADAVCRLIENPVLAREMGKRGRNFAAGFQWGTAARTLCELALA